jgi:hypothetical protein
MKGYVYAMTNPDMHGLVKIGKSDNPERRAADLHSTGSARPFVVVKSVEVADMDQAEKLLHEQFSAQRINARREWFGAPLPEVLAALEKLVGSEHYETSGPWHKFHEKRELDPEGFQAEKDAEQRRRIEEDEGPGALVVYANDDGQLSYIPYSGEAWKQFEVGYAGLVGAFDCGSYRNAKTIELMLTEGPTQPTSVDQVKHLCALFNC